MEKVGFPVEGNRKRRTRIDPFAIFQAIFPGRIPIRVKLSIAIIFVIWLTIIILRFEILARQREQLH